GVMALQNDVLIIAIIKRSPNLRHLEIGYNDIGDEVIEALAYKCHKLEHLELDEEKQKHIIGLVLEQFSYLSLKYSEKYGDSFNLVNSASCLICNGDHKEKGIKNSIMSIWGSGEYYKEHTYRLECGIVPHLHRIPIVNVKV
ncbi:19746_t:CDS:2, partial [Funneliformis geosporum]